MHKRQILFPLFLGLFLLTACQKEPIKSENKDIPKKEEPKPEDNNPPSKPTDLFPKADNSRELKGYPAERVFAILTSINFDKVLPLGETKISETQLKEIKNISDELIREKKAKTQREKHDALFGWIRKNVKYGHVFKPNIPDYNSAYTTFKYQEAICQGYSNLLKVMCYTQGITAPVTNGLARFNTLGDPGGHAWNYVLLDGKWFVSDATNGIFYDANDSKKYDFLLPERLDFPLWKDDKITYTYQNRELTAETVLEIFTDTKLIVPYSVAGFQIGNFNPKSLPKSVTEVYLGANIKMLGVPGRRHLIESGKNIEKIFIDPANAYLEEYKGAIYEKAGNTEIPILIPAQLKSLTLKPIKTVGKNIIYGHEGLQELRFGEGTDVIEDYAIEACPNLQTVYIPKSVRNIGKQAFYRCNPKLKIVRV
ncbi:MAG: transglutaminase domain-containing protein [Porphyromonas sp.]|nr:transglutaminase domain-containing protein [Porphyromonas sp.]